MRRLTTVAGIVAGFVIYSSVVSVVGQTPAPSIDPSVLAGHRLSDYKPQLLSRHANRSSLRSPTDSVSILVAYWAAVPQSNQQAFLWSINKNFGCNDTLTLDRVGLSIIDLYDATTDSFLSLGRCVQVRVDSVFFPFIHAKNPATAEALDTLIVHVRLLSPQGAPTGTILKSDTIIIDSLFKLFPPDAQGVGVYARNFDVLLPVPFSGVGIQVEFMGPATDTLYMIAAYEDICSGVCYATSSRLSHPNSFFYLNYPGTLCNMYSDGMLYIDCNENGKSDPGDCELFPLQYFDIQAQLTVFVPQGILGGATAAVSPSSTVCSGDTISITLTTGADSAAWQGPGIISRQNRGRSITAVPTAVTGSPTKETKNYVYTLYDSLAGAICTGPSDTVSITVFEDKPFAIIYVVSQSGNAVMFTSDSSLYDPVTCVWDFGPSANPSASLGCGNKLVQFPPGTHTVTLIAQNPCGSDTAVRTISIGTTATEDINKAETPVVIAQDHTQPSIIYLLAKKPFHATVEVADLTGKVVLQRKVSLLQGEHETVKLSGFAPGSYLVKVSGEGVQEVKHLFIR